jgi:outer membrane protein OmpA-like peptidoglycan-associated protein
MISQRRVAVITFALATAVIAACAKKEPPAPTPTPVPVAQPNQDSIELARRDQMRRDSVQRAESARRLRQQQVDDSIANARAAADAAAREAEAMRSTIARVVNYDFDKADLREDTRQALDAKIPILNANPALTIRIAGHTDSRGSGEYNLQLGQRRAEFEITAGGTPLRRP